MDITSNYTYIVHSSKEIERCKIGYWKSSLKSLRSRYVTSYGGDLKLYTYETFHPIICETAFKLRYQQYHIINELYDINYIEEYKKFYSQLANKNDTDINYYITLLYTNNILNFSDVISDNLLHCKRCDYETDKIYVYNQHNILCKEKSKIKEIIATSDKKYECPRCGYETEKLFPFVKHLERKIICDPIKGDISLDDLKAQYIKPKTLSCDQCDMLFKSLFGLTKHKKVCDNIIKKETMVVEFENMKKELAELRKMVSYKDNDLYQE
jgi:hypothetical protein